jgi:hypothetical protein
MTVSNHTLTAANIAIIFQQWWAVPIAFVSHFIIDTFPHYGERISSRNLRFTIIEGIDALFLLAIFWFAIAKTDTNHLLLVISMFVAFIPDAIWVYRFYREKRGESDIPKNRFSKFHSRVNWYERRWGIIIEAMWLVAMTVLLFSLTR